MSINAAYSLWFLIPCLLIAVAASYFLYAKDSWFSQQIKVIRYTLRGLRFFSVFLLLILLIGIIYQQTNYKEEKPVIITLIDNSASMVSFKDSAAVKQNTKKLEASLKEKFGDAYQLDFYSIGSKFKVKSNLNFKESSSALDLGFESICNQYFNRNIGAVLFVSDGNYNIGENPLYAAEKLKLCPIFTLGAGDTVPRKDQLIKNTVYNDLVFLKSQFPLEIDIESNRIQNKNAVLSVWHNGKKIGSQTVNYDQNKHQFHQFTFLIDANTSGFQAYQIKLSQIEGEQNLKNNLQTIYVDVIDSRSKLLFLSSAPHPDISAMRSALSENENLTAEYQNINEFKIGDSRPDLVVWHEPGVGYNEKIQNYLNEKKIPTLYILGPNTNSNISNKLKVISINNSKNQNDEIRGSFNSGFSTFELSDRCKEAIAYYPPLTSKFGSVSPLNMTSVLINQRVGTITKKDPLFYFGRNQDQAFGVIYGEGIWRWKLNDFTRNANHENFNELINKSINFLLVKQQGEGLSISFEKRLNKEDQVIFNASFYNAALMPITQPEIQLQLKSNKGKIFKAQFGASGTSYKANLGKLSPGKYEWSARTTFQGQTYKKSGYFVIEDISLEQNNAFANHNTLKQLSNSSGGKYRPLSAYQKSLTEILNRDDIATIEYQEHAFIDLIDLKLLFLLLLIALGAEWFIRRYYGHY